MRTCEVHWMSLAEIESEVCDVTAGQLGLRRPDVHPGQRLVQDLHCDSLDLVELLMEIEDHFRVDLPGQSTDMAYKCVFTRSPFRLADLAELVYLRQGCERVGRPRRWNRTALPEPTGQREAFTQLGGRFDHRACGAGPSHEWLGRCPSPGGCERQPRRLAFWHSSYGRQRLAVVS